LIFGPADSVGWWDERFIGPLGVVRGAGLILTAAGLGLAVWARMHLGRFWTGDVAVLGRHELIERGPYARLRHPIYSGVLLAAAGTVVSIGERRALFGFACLMLGLWWKARREEGFMRRELGTAYDDYRQRTGFLIPPLRRRGARIR
jgi:protein-S-isoprenylcysteine O-methyltransferase Ste14